MYTEKSSNIGADFQTKSIDYFWFECIVCCNIYVSFSSELFTTCVFGLFCT